MKTTFGTLVKIYNTNSRKEKGLIVEANKDDNKLLKLFQLAMDDYMIYGISEKTFEKFMNKKEFYYKPQELDELYRSCNQWNDSKFDTFTNKLIPYLLESQSPSNESLNELLDFFNDLNPVEQYFYYRTIIKNLSIGIGPKSINKACGKLLIKQYTPGLADSGIAKFDKWKFDNKKEYYTDTKINGLRLSIFFKKDLNQVEVKTRSGRHFKELEIVLTEWFKDENGGKNIIKQMLEKGKPWQDGFDAIVIDCELQHIDKTWESSISVINTNDYDIFENDNPTFFLHVFDITNDVPFKPENFNIETNTKPFSERRKLVEEFISLCNNTHKTTKLFKKTECVIIDDLSKAEDLAKKYIENGYEGAVIKHPDSKYVCGRTIYWLKIKDIQTYDGVITDIMPGELSGKYNNVAGKISVKVTINGKELEGTCGSGFKESDRKMLWENKEQMIGKTVEFTILGKTVTNNFQSGIFKGIRIDK